LAPGFDVTWLPRLPQLQRSPSNPRSEIVEIALPLASAALVLAAGAAVVLLVRRIGDQDRATPVRVQGTVLRHQGVQGQEPRRRRQLRSRPVEGLGVGASRGRQAPDS